MGRHLATMALPFDTQQFLAVFAAYNAAIWPAQIVAYALGCAALAAFVAPHPLRERIILAVLATMWAWNGLAYHLSFFSQINTAAYGFAALFVLQATVYALYSLKPDDARFEVGSGWRTIIALSLIFYALVIYQVLGIVAGHGLMKGPLFGVAPCPTTIFTIGLLLLTDGRSARGLCTVPLLWAAIGTSAAALLGIKEDLGLGIAGVILAVWLLAPMYRDRSRTIPVSRNSDASLRE